MSMVSTPVSFRNASELAEEDLHQSVGPVLAVAEIGAQPALGVEHRGGGEVAGEAHLPRG